MVVTFTPRRAGEHERLADRTPATPIYTVNQFAAKYAELRIVHPDAAALIMQLIDDALSDTEVR